jgi:hypothetical protein
MKFVYGGRQNSTELNEHSYANRVTLAYKQNSTPLEM